VLHYIGAGEIRDPETIEDLFRSCADWRENNKKAPIPIPYFRDARGRTPLDYCLSQDTDAERKKIKDDYGNNATVREVRLDYARALMAGLKDYPTGHFEALLTIGASLAIEAGVP